MVSVMAVVIVTFVWLLNLPTGIEQQRLYVDAYRDIGIGFLVALLGTIIPNLILESRDNLERAKQSRIAYSQAKTSAMYLPGTLAVLDYGKAMAALQEAHRKLHIAETYGKELDEYLKWYGDKKIWTDQLYWGLTAVRMLLQSRAGEWDDHMKIGDRTIAVKGALQAIEDLFGPKGEHWKRLSKVERLSDTQKEKLAIEVVEEALKDIKALGYIKEKLALEVVARVCNSAPYFSDLMTPELNAALKRYTQLFGSYTMAGELKNVRVWLTLNEGKIEFLTPTHSLEAKRVGLNRRVECLVGDRRVPGDAAIVHGKNAMWRTYCAYWKSHPLMMLLIASRIRSRINRGERVLIRVTPDEPNPFDGMTDPMISH